MVKIGTVFRLNEGEQKLCTALAEWIQENKEQRQVPNAKLQAASDTEVHLEGLGGEIAFCYLFNVFPDLSIRIVSARQGQDKEAGAWYRARAIDVKTTPYPKGRLLGHKYKEGFRGIFVLMVGKFPTYRYMGAMDARVLIRPDRLGTLGYGPVYIAEQYELRDLDAIVREEYLQKQGGRKS